MMEPTKVNAKPGSTSGLHVDHAGDELLYVLAGTVRVELRDFRTEELEAGDCFYYPATVPHRWAVTGQRPARFLVIATPSSI
jgi:mannose-6-phosphate isomerase-like protein (cupin superfamily)